MSRIAIISFHPTNSGRKIILEAAANRAGYPFKLVEIQTRDWYPGLPPVNARGEMKRTRAYIEIHEASHHAATALFDLSTNSGLWSPLAFALYNQVAENGLFKNLYAYIGEGDVDAELLFGTRIPRLDMLPPPKKGDKPIEKPSLMEQAVVPITTATKAEFNRGRNRAMR